MYCMTSSTRELGEADDNSRGLSGALQALQEHLTDGWCSGIVAL